MKKSRLLILPAALLAISVVACSTDNGGDDTSTTTTAASGEIEGVNYSGDGNPIITQPVEITFWHTFGSGKDTVIDNIVARFQELEPNVTVNAVKQSTDYSGLYDMVVTGIAANNYPDMVVAYPDHVATYLDYGIAVNMEPYMYNSTYGWSDDDIADIIPNYLEEGQEYSVEGTYSLPIAKSSEALFYNEDVLIGLDLSGVDATINDGEPITADYLNSLTWEELFEKLCPAIEAYDAALDTNSKILKTDQTYHSIFSYDSDDNLFITLAQQYGYDYTAVDTTTGTGQILFNNDGMKGLMKTLNAAANDGYLLTSGSAGDTYTNNYFTVQNILLSVGSTAGYSYQVSSTFNVGVARIPYAEGNDRYVINQGPSVAFLETNASDSALRKVAAWLFYEYFTSEDENLYWATESGYMPVRYSVYETNEYAEYASTEGKVDYSEELLAAKVAAYQETITNDLFTSAVFKGSSTARTQAGSIVTQVCLQSAEDCTDEWLNGIFETAVNQVLLAM